MSDYDPHDGPPDPAEAPAMPGGCGGTAWAELLTDPRRYRSDLLLIARAARENWPVAPDMAARLLARIMGLMNDPTQPSRVRMRAVKTLTSLAGIPSTDGRGDAGATLARQRWRKATASGS